MSTKTPEQLKNEYYIAAAVAGVAIITLFFISYVFMTSSILSWIAILIIPFFISFLVKASVYSKAAKTGQATESVQASITKTSKNASKVGMIVSGIVLALSILAPFITGAIVGAQCRSRGATNESSCPEGWMVLFVMLGALPFGLASVICFIITAISYFAKKNKLKAIDKNH